MSKLRLTINTARFQQNEGYTLTGRGEGLGIHGLKIFVFKRQTAESIRDAFMAEEAGTLDKQERIDCVHNLIMSEVEPPV